MTSKRAASTSSSAKVPACRKGTKSAAKKGAAEESVAATTAGRKAAGKQAAGKKKEAAGKKAAGKETQASRAVSAEGSAAPGVKASKSAKKPAAKRARKPLSTGSGSKASTPTVAKSSPKSPAAKRTTASGTTSAAEATPNRAAEDPWTDAELAGIRQQLAADIEALNAEITQAAEHLDQLEVGPAGTSGDDPVDSGARAYDRENELSLVRNARQMIQQCEEAVARLDDGSYGTCASCGEPIPKLRLQAFPRASLCIACKQRSERH